MAPRAALPLAALLVLLPAGGVVGECNVTQFSTQLDGMLSTYDRESAPRAPTLVEVSLQVRHATINEDSAQVRLLADFRLSWQDERLGWNASEGECDSALVSVERLWRPDVGLLGAGSARDGDGRLRALLTAAGRVTWVARLDLDAPVTLDLTAWPYDQHRIMFKFGSRSHFEDEIELMVKFQETATVFESGSWELVSVETSETEWQRAGAWKRVALFAVNLRRRAAAQALAAGAVRAGAALLLLAAATLPPDARPPVCAAASFTSALWLSSAMSRLGSSSSAPRVLAALGALCACGGAAAAAAALALRVARCPLPAPPALRKLRSHPVSLRLLSSLQAVRGGASEEGGAWLAAARLLDALCVLALVLAVLLTELLVAVLP